MYRNRVQQYDNINTPDDDSKSQLMEFVQPTIEKVSETIASRVRKQPLAGVVVGLTIGVVLGCLIKRR